MTRRTDDNPTGGPADPGTPSPFAQKNKSKRDRAKALETTAHLGADHPDRVAAIKDWDARAESEEP